MNTPCITVADVTPEGGDNGHCVAVISMPPGRLAGKGIDERRKVVDATLRDAVRQAERTKILVQVGFAHAAKIPRGVLRATAKDRWNLLLSSTPVKDAGRKHALLETYSKCGKGLRQVGCLDVFYRPNKLRATSNLNPRWYTAQSRARNFHRWRVDWDGLVLFYPYLIKDGEAVPAFTLDPSKLSDSALASKMRASGFIDALDFDKQLEI